MSADAGGGEDEAAQAAGAHAAGRAPARRGARSHLARCPVFYGFVQAAFGTMGMIATGPGQTPVIGTTITALSKDLALGRTTISSLYLLATLCSACVLPFMGRLLDRLGPPPMFAAASVSLGLACWAFAYFAHHSVTLGVAFFCLRFFGQGTLSLVSQNAINLWFEKRRGRVMGVCTFVNALCLTGLFSSAVKARVERTGWRDTYVLLGGLELGLVAPLGLMFIRHRPEAYGLGRDGEPSRGYDGLRDDACGVDAETEAVAAALPQEAADDADADFVAGAPSPTRIGSSSPCTAYTKTPSADLARAPDAADFTCAESVRTLAFWAMSGGAFAAAAFCTAIFFHLDAIFSDPGQNASLNLVYIPSAVTAGVTTMVAGILIDFVRPQYVMAASMLALAAALVCAAAVAHTRAARGWLAAVGVCNGLVSSFNLSLAVSNAKWFGLAHNGEIQGLANALVVLGSAVGPAAVSVGHDVLGDYPRALLLSAAVPLCCAGLACVARDPSK